jgi:hypothetical protein
MAVNKGPALLDGDLPVSNPAHVRWDGQLREAEGQGGAFRELLAKCVYTMILVY